MQSSGDFVGRGAFGNIALGTEIQRLLNGFRIFVGADDQRGHRRKLIAQRHQTGKTIAARHVQIQQHQFAVALLFQHLSCLWHVASFQNQRLRINLLQTATQSGTKQRMVIGDKICSMPAIVSNACQ